MRRIVTVGMHRSGTSFITRLLNLCGVDLGSPDKLVPPMPSNPTGFWEPRPLVRFHDRLLEELGGTWDHPPPLFPGWHSAPDLDRFRRRANEVLSTVFGEVDESAVIGWKDPRCSLLLPFWRTVLRIDAEVLMVRDPSEVASSVQARDGLDPEHTAALWLRYHLAALRNTDDPLVLDYAEALDDITGTVHRLTQLTGTRGPTRDGWRQVYEFADPAARHHQGLSHEPGPVMRAARRLYEHPELAEELSPLLLDGVQADAVVAAVGTRPAAAARRFAALQAEVEERRAPPGPGAEQDASEVGARPPARGDKRPSARAASDLVAVEAWADAHRWSQRSRLACPWRLGLKHALTRGSLQLPPEVRRWATSTVFRDRLWVALPWRAARVRRRTERPQEDRAEAEQA